MIGFVAKKILTVETELKKIKAREKTTIKQKKSIAVNKDDCIKLSDGTIYTSSKI